MKKTITDDRYAWINQRKQYDKYGKLEIGQRVKLTQTIYAPTNSAEKLSWFKRDEAGEVVDNDPTIELVTHHTISDLRDSESGVFVFLVDNSGLLSVKTSNAYGQTHPGFIAVVREAMTQREFAA